MTTFSYIFEEFLDKITDPELLMLSEDLKSDTLEAYLRKAISRVQRDFLPSVDLSNVKYVPDEDNINENLLIESGSFSNTVWHNGATNDRDATIFELEDSPIDGLINGVECSPTNRGVSLWQALPLKAGKKYTISGYYRLSPNSTYTSANGAVTTDRRRLVNGSYIYEGAFDLIYTIETNSDEWTYFTKTFVIGEGTFDDIVLYLTSIRHEMQFCGIKVEAGDESTPWINAPTDVDVIEKELEDLPAFREDLPYEVIDILTEWMVAYWLKPYVNNLENLRNNLNTKDFTSFSPANLLEKVGDRYTAARRYARSLSNEYSIVINDLTTLTTSKRR